LPGAGPRSTPTPVAAINLVLLAGAVLLVSATSLAESALVNLAGVLGAALTLAVFVYRERTRGPRILPRSAFATGSHLPFVYVVIALLAMASTAETFVPLFGDRLASMPPLAAGFLGAALAAGWTLGSMPSAGVSGRTRGTLIGLAPIVCALGLAGLALTARADASWALVAAWVALLLLAGVGVGIAWPHLPIAVMGAADEKHEQASAGASFTTVQMVATALGSALAGTLANVGGVDGDAGDVAHAASLMYGAMALLVLLGTPAARRVGRRNRTG
ncbi:MFS transporter, partial [Streptomyces sp. SID3343]|nr:MFS transporter [Streptomyces sp. SID3343]